jgi:phage-related protein
LPCLALNESGIPIKTCRRLIRIKSKDGAFRVFYVVSRPEAIYVLHAFRKTTQKTEKSDIDLAKVRYKSLD